MRCLNPYYHFTSEHDLESLGESSFPMPAPCQRGHSGTAGCMTTESRDC